MSARARGSWLPLPLLVVVAAAGCAVSSGASAPAVSAEAARAAALAWVNGLAAPAGEAARALTADPFLFRAAGPDRRCEGWIRGRPALAAWFPCALATDDLRQYADMMKLYAQWTREAPDAAADIAANRPRVVDGDPGWRGFRSDEDQRGAEQRLDAFRRQAGGGGSWVSVVASWLYTVMTFRVQVIGAGGGGGGGGAGGAGGGARVRAVFVDVGRFPD